jgi:arsenate reductase
MKRVLILCTGNSCRSQMAEGFLRLYSKGKAEVRSAGIEAHGLNERAVEVMLSMGVDIRHHTSNTMDAFRDEHFDFVLTVCDHANEVCPVFPGAVKRFHASFPDPARAVGSEEEILAQFQLVCKAIRDYCYSFSEKYLTNPSQNDEGNA